MEKNRRIMNAVAKIQGGSNNSDLNGTITFVQTNRGVLVTVKVDKLPQTSMCKGSVFAIHIHDGISCTGNETDEFADAGNHYDPYDCPHPYHAGDLPSLIENEGFAYMSVLTNRFTVSEIIGKVVVIHGNKDDFTTQPSGNSGKKIACGQIKRI